MKELEPHGIEAAAACPCQCQQSDGEHNAGELKRMNRKIEQVRPPYLRIASPSHVVLQLFHTLVFSPDADVAASNQPRACNRLLVHQRSADGFAVHLPSVLECQFQTPAHFSFGQLIDDLLQFSFVEADVPFEESFSNLQGIVDNQRGGAVSLYSDVALLAFQLLDPAGHHEG